MPGGGGSLPGGGLRGGIEELPFWLLGKSRDSAEALETAANVAFSSINDWKPGIPSLIEFPEPERKGSKPNQVMPHPMHYYILENKLSDESFGDLMVIILL